MLDPDPLVRVKAELDAERLRLKVGHAAHDRQIIASAQERIDSLLDSLSVILARRGQ